MRLFAALALLALALAGCSGGEPDAGTPAPTSTSSTSTAPPPPPLPTSDTMHFLAAPDMAAALPAGSSEVATPVSPDRFGGGDGGGQGQEDLGAEWRHVVEHPTNVTAGEIRIWINIKETLYESPGTPLDAQCTWALTVAIGADNDEIDLCLNDPAGPIAAGVRELVFSLVLPSAINLEANETITVTLERSAFSLSANNAVDALSGSADHDSILRLAGLKEPIRTK
ncbi:MAG: hypothetical protein WC876_07295 [Candidatus Thermoplasmatota archaeon]|jgi:hypothetical protein